MLPKLFVDLDGTLCVFRYVGAEVYSAPGYYYTLEPHKEVVKAIRFIIRHKLMEVFIVSAVLPFDHCIRDKNAWIDKYLPEIDEAHRIYVPIGENKGNYMDAHKGDIHLDDWNGNLNELLVTSVVEPVKLVNAINDKNKSWKGARVYYNSDAYVIAQMLYGLSLANLAA